MTERTLRGDELKEGEAEPRDDNEEKNIEAGENGRLKAKPCDSMSLTLSGRSWPAFSCEEFPRQQ
jgi:hypothetical protein